MPAALLVHGGGPTQVINATLAGVADECRAHPEITALYGARFGIDGVLSGDFIDLLSVPPERIAAVGRTPGSALGSSRAAVRDYSQVLDSLRRHDIRYLFFNGGNGSMVMAHQIAQAAADTDLRVIGIPKTIDNDIPGTDHTPGYGSTAWFFACAVRDIGEDIRALPGRVSIVEIMGRSVGWLTAATVFARHDAGDPPHLIYLPERPLHLDRFFADVEAVLHQRHNVVIAACEGQKDETGRPIGDLGTPDGFQRQLSGNMAHTLAQLLIKRLGINARSEKPGLLGRSSMSFISEVDWNEAYRCGQAAVRAALADETGCMISLLRAPGSAYRIETTLVRLETIAGRERAFPQEWIAASGNDVTPEFLNYARPLLGAMRYHARL